jgi:Cu/Ag efflux protein CusF
MQPEIHATEPPAPAVAGDLLPPQRRKGVPRITAILGIGLLAAATFLAGIEAQKQWGGSSSNGLSGRAAAFAAANGGARPVATGAQGAPRANGGFFGRAGGGFTSGTVKLVQGSTIYVTTSDGNVVKVTVPGSATITKSVTEKVSGIKPGDTVTAIGTTSNGVVKAATVRVGDTGLPGGFGRRAGAQGGTNGGTTPSP